LERLVELRDFRFFGNVLALRGIPSLPQVRELHLSHGYGFNVPLRSLADLPAMPELRRLYLQNTDELHGLERDAKLLNLEIFGYSHDLAPLAKLQQLTHVKLSGGDYPTLARLAEMSQLRRLVVCREEPPDFTPLVEAPRLHEIKLEISHLVPPELGPINAMFPPWSDEFAVHPPRPLAPLKLRRREGGRHIESDSGGQPRDWGEDRERGCSEHVWFVREVTRRLNALLGKDWGAGKEDFRWPPGNLQVTLCPPEDLDRIPEVVQCLREALATTRHPWSCLLIVNRLADYQRELEEIYAADGEEFDAKREREHWESEHQKRREHDDQQDRQRGPATGPKSEQRHSRPGQTDRFVDTKAKAAETPSTVRLHVNPQLPLLPFTNARDLGRRKARRGYGGGVPRTRFRKNLTQRSGNPWFGRPLAPHDPNAAAVKTDRAPPGPRWFQNDEDLANSI
jgi:hypothetical protein